MKVRNVLLAVLILLITAPAAHAIPIDALVPPVSQADESAQVTIVASGLGSVADYVQFPGNKLASPVAMGTDWIRVVVPKTWSGNVRAWVTSAGQWTDFAEFEVTWSQFSAYPSGSVDWYLHQDGAPGESFAETEKQSIGAYDTWECASDFDHSYKGSTAVSPSVGYDGINVLGWGDFGLGSGTIAQCTFWTSMATGELLEFDIEFNSANFTWGVNDPGAMDIMNLATHELGHSIGFLDQYGAEDFPETMYGYSMDGQVTHSTLEIEDLVGAESVYGHATGRTNLAPVKPAGWHSPIGLRNIADMSSGAAPLPALLNGNIQTYVGWNVRNSTAECTPWAGHRVGFFVDEVFRYFGHFSGNTLPAFSPPAQWSNVPQVVRGGLHTMRVEADVDGSIIESSENDNSFQAQFAYTPAPLIPSQPAVTDNQRPPVTGLLPSPNCTGYESGTAYWGVVGMIPHSPQDDYDLWAYDDDKAPLTGFRNVQESTYVSAGETEFMVFNGNVLGYASAYNVGVVEYDAPAGSAVYLQSAQEFETTEIPASNQGEPIVIGEFPIASMGILTAHELSIPDATAPISVALTNLSPGVNLNMAVYGPDQAYYQQYAALSTAASGGVGQNESLQFEPPVSGYYLVVVWKDRDDLADAAGYRITVGRAATNISAQVVPAGWDDVVVPRDAGDVTLGSAPLPPQLTGNAEATWMNYAAWNSGPGNTPPYALRVLLDGVPFDGGFFTGPIPPGTIPLMNRGPFEMRGGRHTLGFQVDYTAAVFETNELDNVFAQQYVWSPLDTYKQMGGVRAAPPSPGVGLHPNADGMRFAHAANHAWVVATAARTAGDDVDLMVYDDYSGPLSGFSNLRGASLLADSATDFVVGYLDAIPGDVMSAAVRTTGTGDFVHDQDDAFGSRYTLLGSGQQVIGEQLGPDRLVNLYSLLLGENEVYSITLRRTSGTDEVEFEIFDQNPVVNSRGFGLAQPTVHNDDLQFATFTSTFPSWYPLVVYRTDGEESDEVVTYDLLLNSGQPTAAPDPGAVSQLSFSMAHPNPSPGQSSVSFALPAPGPCAWMCSMFAAVA